MNHIEELQEAIDTMKEWLAQNAPPTIMNSFAKILVLTEICEADALGYTDNPMYAEAKADLDKLRLMQ